MGEAVKPQFNALEAINFAIAMERNGNVFYNKAAAITTDQDGKEMFFRLASDELAHIYWLITIRQSLVRTGEFGNVEYLFTEENTTLIEESAIFPLSGRETEISSDTRELDALEMAIAAEKDAIAYYQQAAENTEDAGGKTLFKHLAEWESEHLRVLQAEHDYLTNNGFYLSIAEFEVEGPEYLRWWRR